MGRVAIKRLSLSPGVHMANRVAVGLLPSVLLDLLSVLVFVGVGHVAHGEPLTPAGLGSTGWPFLIGLAGGYLGVALTRWPASSLAGGAMVGGKTIVLGLVVRYGIQRAGTPLSFVIVTTVVLLALILGWRLAAERRAT